MKKSWLRVLAVAILASPWATAASSDEAPKIQIPQPGVPQIMTIEGRYVRAAYNNEGYAILGYRVANDSVGEPWMLLEFGITLRQGMPDFHLKREALSLDTPDGKTIPLPTTQEFRKASLGALKQRSQVQRDSINYFPPNATRACSLQFFTDLDQRAKSWDEVFIDNTRACLGRLYFPVPGGIAHGQYWLNVRFPQSVLRVPFRILTKEENKLLDKNFTDIKKQVDEAFKSKE